ncbi:MAG: sensor histidine kinase [Anaerolineae bacterium]|nr:sensor histidine kinase [Anaerolineae bacterium]MCB9107574.1 sensor histidine kinase [Anaerolineales bacterium]
MDNETNLTHPLPDTITTREQLWTLIGGVSVRTKILGIVLTLTIVLGLVVTWEVRTVMQHNLLNELELLGHAYITDLSIRSVAPLKQGDLPALRELLTETVANHPDVRYAFIVDVQNQVIAHSFPDHVRDELLNLTFADLSAQSLLHNYTNTFDPDGHGHHIHFENNEGHIHEFAALIADDGGETLRVGLSEARLHDIINRTTWQMLLTTVVVGLFGILAAMLLTWVLTRPILDLVTATERVRQGDLTVRVPHWADDEIGALADAFNQMTCDLEVSHRAIEEKEAARTRLLAQLINAQEEERKRIARELHDGVGQALTSLLVGLKILNQHDDPAVLQNKAVELRQVATETLENVRLLSRQLRPSALDDLGLAAAVERYLGEFSKLYPALPVDFHADLPNRLPSTVETSLYRIVQEAMTNAARHSDATALSVLLTQRNGQVQAIVEDNGHGFDPEGAARSGSSVGIHGMFERADLLGGQVQIESSEEGTTIYAEIPI